MMDNLYQENPKEISSKNNQMSKVCMGGEENHRTTV
jgi:hypothetical protein